MRPESHKIGDLAETLTQEVFLSNDWIVNRCHSDYGYDFLIMRDFDGSFPSGFAFLQVKGLGGYASSDNASLSHVQIEARHLRQWDSCPIPVFLCIVHVTARSVYVISIKEIVRSLRLEHGAEWASAKSRRIKVNVKHLFSSELADKLSSEIGNYWMAVRRAWLSSEGLIGLGMTTLPQSFLLFEWVARLQAYFFQHRLRRYLFSVS